MPAIMRITVIYLDFDLDRDFDREMDREFFRVRLAAAIRSNFSLNKDAFPF